MLKHRFLTYLIVALTLFLTPAVLAAADFSTSYEVNYRVDDTGRAEVKQDITLTNHTNDRYIADYTLTNAAQMLEEVSAYDAAGALETLIERQNNACTIKVLLGQKTAGLNTQTSWTLEYQVPEMAVKKGRIWEIKLPGLQHSTPVEALKVSLDIPLTFGPPQYFLPAAISTETIDNRVIYSFTQDEIKNHGLTAAFGNTQLFSFTLTYHLENPLDVEALTEIALLPVLVPRQKVFVNKLEPEPEELVIDDDGNYLASYRLKPQEKVVVTYQGQVETTLNSPQTQEEAFFDQLHARYTKPDKFWEINHESIQAVIDEQLDVTMTPRQKAKKMYNFTVSRLSYNTARFSDEVQRLGAVEALKQPDNAVCMEYTDLLIALLRAAGIPARELDGFAYSPETGQEQDGDILHSWVQFYDRDAQTWVQVDPTWEATSTRDYFNQLDTDRIIFVVKGLDSERPYPAGCYKDEENLNGQDVDVQFAESREAGTVPFGLWESEFERGKKPVDIFLWFNNLFSQLWERIRSLVW